MGPGGKWIEGIGADASIVEAARLSLASRLTAVAHWLPLAAYHADQDSEHVHKLRVSTRRAVAALKLYRGLLPPKHFRWVKKRLKRIRRAAGDARDLDVLAERMLRQPDDRDAEVLAEIRRRRRIAQLAIEQIAGKCSRKGRFLRKTGGLLAGIRPRNAGCKAEQPGSFGAWARSEITVAADSLFEAMPTASSEPSALHQFRIRGKALRYTIELVAAAFGPQLRLETYPLVEELQERLGAINDHVTAANLLRAWREESSENHERERYDVLIENERRAVAKRIDEFHQWWIPGRCEDLRRELAPAGAETPSTGQTAEV
jgi:CHAD domain-containing protein